MRRLTVRLDKDLINDKAGMGFVGDLTKPMFAAAKTQSGFDYTCVPAPGTGGMFTYEVDSFSMFRPQNVEKIKAQQEFATGMLTPAIQVQFNLDKGSIPVREPISAGSTPVENNRPRRLGRRKTAIRWSRHWRSRFRRTSKSAWPRSSARSGRATA